MATVCPVLPQLSNQHDFRDPTAARERLLNDNTFGGHLCELCNDKTQSGEIRVFGQDKIVYAAHTMIYHYVADHHYLPPEEFIQAVLTSPLPDSEEFRLRAREYLWSDSLEGYYAWLQRRNESS